MPNTPVFFSSADYYKDYDFTRLMRNWNKYMEYTGGDDDVMAEWEEILLKDFLNAAKNWLKCYGKDYYNGKHLE